MRRLLGFSSKEGLGARVVCCLRPCSLRVWRLHLLVLSTLLHNVYTWGSQESGWHCLDRILTLRPPEEAPAKKCVVLLEYATTGVAICIHMTNV
jgi:hypothetical protein